MPSRQKFLWASLPLCAVLLGCPAQAAILSPLTVVQEPFVVPKNILPHLLGDVGRVSSATYKAVARKPLIAPQLHYVVAAKRAEKKNVHARKMMQEFEAAWQQATLEAEKTASTAVGQCHNQTVSWQRECSSVGYPQSYVGLITGETQLDCATNEQRDVWLQNSCSAPVAVASVQVTPVNTEVADAAMPLPSTPVAAPIVSVASLPALTLQAVNPVEDTATSVADLPTRLFAQVEQPFSDQPLFAIAEPIAIHESEEQSGVCGGASKQLFVSAPKDDLCASGTASPLFGQGPWQWSCSGTTIYAKAANCTAMVDVAAITTRTLPPAAPVTAPVAAVLAPPQPEALVALTTPQLSTPSLTTTTTVTSSTNQTPPLATAALATPRLLGSNDPHATNYVPAEPIRSGAVVTPTPASAGLVLPHLAMLKIEPGHDAPDDAILSQLEVLGQKLAANRLAQVTVTAYAKTDENYDARAARRLSLARAMVVRDALMMGGAGSEQIRMRALGGNVTVGEPDRVDLSDR